MRSVHALAPARPREADFATRCRFVCELAKRLHQFGTSAPRLEAAIDAAATRLDLTCNIWSNPTGIILSFVDGLGDEDRLATVTQVIRLAPGDVNLRRLSVADEIGDQVSSGEIDIAEGVARLRHLNSPTHPLTRWAVAIAHGVAAATVAVLLKAGWNAVLSAGLIGLVIGQIGRYARPGTQLAHGYEALAALVAALLANLIGSFWMPVSVNAVVIAGLIVLLPGMMLTTAVTELATQNLVSGMSRFAGAIAVLLKLGFGTAAGMEIARLVGVAAPVVGRVPVPGWMEWVALLVGSANFAVLFRTAPRDYPVVMASAWLGYLTTRFASAVYGAEFGVFVAGLVVGAAANAYARWGNRPGALVRVPGIILLVPGSVGFRGVFSAFEGDVSRGIDIAVTLLLLLISLVAGLLFANLIVAPRRTLS